MKNVRWTLISVLLLFFQGPAVFSQENAVQRVPETHVSGTWLGCYASSPVSSSSTQFTFCQRSSTGPQWLPGRAEVYRKDISVDMDQVTSTGGGGPDGLDVTASAYGLALRGMGLRRQLPRVQARKLAPAIIASDIERLDKYLK